MRRLLLVLMMLIGFGVRPALAQAPTDPLQQRADEIVRFIRGEGDPATTFAPSFLAQVPPAQMQAISAQLQGANGPIQRVERIDRQGPHMALVHFGFERAIVQMRLGVEPAAPHLVNFLLVTGTEPRGTDSAEAIITELRALPGHVSFQIARLGDGAATAIASLEPDRALAIGSTFKLIILAELSRQIGAGQHRWDEVVRLERLSLPSGILQDWPIGSPVTVHSLASLMISRSDNTATDALLHFVGRENVERMMARIGMANAARNRPFLSTIEAFSIKADSPENRTQFVSANEAARRRLLAERYGSASGTGFDLTRLLGGAPNAIDTVEWFASAADLVKVMDWLRRNGDDTAKAVMAILPGMDRQRAGEHSYVGFKGGSEPGVINLTYLLRSNAGVWHVVTGSWNNTQAAVDEAKFAGLMGRAVRLVR